MKKIVFLFLVLLSFSNTLKAQSDSTEIKQSGYFLTFVKKVYLNPTVKIRTKAFKTKTNLEFVALPDLASEKTNASSGFEKGLQKVLRFLMQSDGGVRFYFNPDSTTHPFRFWFSENLGCKFKQADKDSIDYYLNHNFADGNVNMNNALRFETTIDKALDYIEKCITANPQECGDDPQNETLEINTKPLSISLHNRVNSQYDIDNKQYEKLESHYAKATDIFTQQIWFAPSKLLVVGPEEEDEPLAIAIHSNEGDFLKQNIKIEILKTHQLLPITTQSTEDNLFFNLPKTLPPGDPVEVVVKYKSPKDSATYTVGFFMVNVMERETKNLVLIPANGFVISSTFKDSVETELEKIYGQASIDFNVTIETGLAFPNDYPTTIEIESSGLFSNYTSDLRDYVGEVQDLENYDEENYYLIIGLESTELQGYMPRARNIGFIFEPKNLEERKRLPKVIAHEIGHGAFHFRHIFSDEELGEEEQGQTNNIMDYVANPKDLYLHQWNFIKNPAFVSWFGGDDEEGEFSVIIDKTDLLEFKDGDFFHFIMPSGNYFSLPTTIQSVEISLLERYLAKDGSPYVESDYVAPIGSLVSFVDKNGKYWFHRKGELTYFHKNSNGSEEEYKESDYNEKSKGNEPVFSTGGIVVWVKFNSNGMLPVLIKRHKLEFSIGDLSIFKANPEINFSYYDPEIYFYDLNTYQYPAITNNLKKELTNFTYSVTREDLDLHFILEDSIGSISPLNPQQNIQIKKFKDITINDYIGKQGTKFSLDEILNYMSFMDQKQSDINQIVSCNNMNTYIQISKIKKVRIFETNVITTFEGSPMYGSSTTTFQTTLIPIYKWKKEIKDIISKSISEQLSISQPSSKNWEGIVDTINRIMRNEILAEGYETPDKSFSKITDASSQACEFNKISFAVRKEFIRLVLFPIDGNYIASQKPYHAVYLLTRFTPTYQRQELLEYYLSKIEGNYQQGLIGLMIYLEGEGIDNIYLRKIFNTLLDWKEEYKKARQSLNSDTVIDLVWRGISPLDERKKLILEDLQNNGNELLLSEVPVIIGGSNSNYLLMRVNDKKNQDIPAFSISTAYTKPIKFQNGKFYLSNSYTAYLDHYNKSGVLDKEESIDLFAVTITEREVSPFQMINVVFGQEYACFPEIKVGESYFISVLDLYLIQLDITNYNLQANSSSGDFIRIVGSVIAIVATVASAGTLGVPAAAFLTTLECIDVFYVSTKDMFSQQEKENSFFYSNWDDFKTSFDIATLGFLGIKSFAGLYRVGTKTLLTKASVFNMARFNRYTKYLTKFETSVGVALNKVKSELLVHLTPSLGVRTKAAAWLIGINSVFSSVDVSANVYKFGNFAMHQVTMVDDAFDAGKILCVEMNGKPSLYTHLADDVMPVKSVGGVFQNGVSYSTSAISKPYSVELFNLTTKRFNSLMSFSGYTVIAKKATKVGSSINPKSLKDMNNQGELIFAGTKSGNDYDIKAIFLQQNNRLLLIKATNSGLENLFNNYQKAEDEDNDCDYCTSYGNATCHEFLKVKEQDENSDRYKELLCNNVLNSLHANGAVRWIVYSTLKDALYYNLTTPTTNNNSQSLSSNKNQLSNSLLDAWSLMLNAKPSSGSIGGLNYCRDYPSLVALNDLLNSTAKNNLGGRDALIEILNKNIRVPCSVCGNQENGQFTVDYLNRMDEYIKDLKYLGENFNSSTTGFSDFLGNQGLKGTLLSHVEGAAFTLRVLRQEGITASEIDGFEMQYNEVNQRVVDIKKLNGVLIECKSWELNASTFTSFVAGSSSSFGQFISYLTNGISSMSGLEYWFDERKITGTDENAKKTAVKQKFQEMMLQNETLTQRGTEVFNAIWGNANLRVSLFGSLDFQNESLSDLEPQAIVLFTTILSNTSNSFYSFIHVK